MKPWADLSSNNGTIDLATAAPNLDGVILKATEGISYTWPDFAGMLNAAKALWPLVGVYHFARPSEASGKQEAEYFLAALGAAGGIPTGAFVVLDSEDPKVDATADLLAHHLDFFDTIERALGVKDFLYSANYYLTPHNLLGHPELCRHPIWYASYQDTQPPTPQGWDKISLWQYTASATVPGIAGPVDLSHLLISTDELKSYCWGYQPDPVAGKPATGTPDVDRGADTPTQIKAALANLRKAPPDTITAIADLSQVLTTFGLVGS